MVKYLISRYNHKIMQFGGTFEVETDDGVEAALALAYPRNRRGWLQISAATLLSDGGYSVKSSTGGKTYWKPS